MTDSVQPRALVIMAHGSRRDSANEEFFSLVASMAEQNQDYDFIKPALLEQAPPTLLETCLSLPAEVVSIDIYPLFFNRGKHVEKDIPAQVAEVMEQLSDKRVRLLPYFGSAEGLAGLVLKHVAEISQNSADL